MEQSIVDSALNGPGTGTRKEKISTWTEVLTQLVEAKFFSRVDDRVRFLRSPLAWKAQG